MFDAEHPRPLPSRPFRRRLAGVAALAGLGLLGSQLATLPAQADPAPPTATSVRVDPARGAAAKPYLGWSSWTLQATNYPGVNPDGPGSFISEQNILAQAEVMAKELKPYGYEYVNIDAGWQDGADEYGRPKINTKRFPHGIKSVADQIHGLGLKAGIYAVVGIGPDAYDDGKTPIFGTTDCHTADIVYPDLRRTNGWDSSLKIDFDNPCAQQYVDSIADLFASWDVDFLKLDGVGPGSFKGGPNYDNTADVAAWSTALHGTGRPIQFVISWALSHRQADTWKAYTNGWRVDTDVECYCDTLVTWDSSVKQRFDDVVQWVDDAGPGHWNNLDSLVVGSGEMDGLTKAERQSKATLWAISAAPLYIGDDLTKLDPYGLSLITNREVIAIDQRGEPARPVNQRTLQQTWFAKHSDGTYTVALFNLGEERAEVTADFADLGITGSARVRDVWAKENLGHRTGSVSASLPSHGSRLFTITPPKAAKGVPAVPVDLRGTGAAGSHSVDLAWRQLPGDRYDGAVSYDVYANGKRVARGLQQTSATVTGLDAATRYSFEVIANGVSGKRSATSKAITVTTAALGGPITYEAEDVTTTTGNAGVSDCPACSGGRKIGNLGGDASMTFTGVAAARAGTYLMQVDYVDGGAHRNAVITVNGQPIMVNFSGSNDNDWGTPQTQTVPVRLQKGANTIMVGNPDDYVSDIDKIVI